MSTLINTSRGSAPSDKPGGDKGKKRTHQAAGLDSSPGGSVGGSEGNDERRKPGVKRAPRGFGNLHPPGDQVIDQQTPTCAVNGKDVNEQPQQVPASRNYMHDRFQNVPAVDYENSGAVAVNPVWLILEHPTL